MRLEHVIRHPSEGVLAGGFQEPLITANTAFEQTDFLRRHGCQGDDLSKLFSGVVCSQAEHPWLSGPPAIAGDQEQPLLLIDLDLFTSIETLAASIEPQNSQPFCQFSQHAINNKMLFRRFRHVSAVWWSVGDTACVWRLHNNKWLELMLFCGAGFPACQEDGRLESLPHKLK